MQTRPDMRSHLRSPDEMNWSNSTCAPLAKSPNCASQIALDGAVNPETIGHPGDLAADILEDSDVDAGDAATRILLLVGRFEASPFAAQPVGLVRLVARACLQLGIEPRAPVGLGLLDL